MFPNVGGLFGIDYPGVVEHGPDTTGVPFDLVRTFGEKGFGEIDEILILVRRGHRA